MHLLDAIFCASARAARERARIRRIPDKAALPSVEGGLDKSKELSDLTNLIAEGINSHKLMSEPHFVILDAQFYKEKMVAPLARWTETWIRR